MYRNASITLICILVAGGTSLPSAGNLLANQRSPQEANPNTVPTEDVGCFTAAPDTACPAVSPTGVVSLCCDLALSWPATPDAAKYHVYFSDSQNAVAQRAPAADKGTTTLTTFALGTLQAQKTYYWCIDTVSAQGVVLPGTIWDFTTAPCVTGGVLQEWWRNLPDLSPGDLRNSLLAPGTPDGQACLDGFEAPSDQGSDSIVRLSAWLLPPASGLYTFWITGEYRSELWLSPDADPAHATSIAGLFRRLVPPPPGQESGPITLLAGQKYYLEALGRGGRGTRPLTISWQGPGVPTPMIVGAPYVENPACTPWFAHLPAPGEGDSVGVSTPILSWRAGREASLHDVYFGTDRDLVDRASPCTGAAYQGRQSQTTYFPGTLAPGTYYWRIDEVNAAAPARPWRGCVWHFTVTSECTVVIDNFESYTAAHPLAQGWVGTPNPVQIEPTVVYAGLQSMRIDYDNSLPPYCSEAQATAAVLSNWTTPGMSTLGLWFHGGPRRFQETAEHSYLMTASGTDVWNKSDQFRFAYKSLTGDGSLTAYVPRIEYTDPWAKGAVMIRETLDADSRHAMAVTSAGGGVSFQYRTAVGADTSGQTVPGMRGPYWVKITRQGNTFSAAFSAEGVSWMVFPLPGESVNIPMPVTVYIGLAVTSHNPNAVTTAEFSHVSTTGSIPGAWRVADIGVPQPGNDPSVLYVRVKDSTGKTAIVSHPDGPNAVLTDAWQKWDIPLSAFAGVDTARLKEAAIGSGDPAYPAAGSVGRLYIDDICLH